MSELEPQQTTGMRSELNTQDLSPNWGASAPRGGRTVVSRALKDGSTVPLFLGQTFVNSLRDLGYNNTTSAICEHVDNALEWGASEVRVYFRQSGKQPHQRIDAMVYDNGKGMAPHVLNVAMAFGGSMVFGNRSGIGRYGIGMKAAAINITRCVEVYSWQEPKAFYTISLDVDKIGQDRKDMVELPAPQLSDTLPSEVIDVFTKQVDQRKGEGSQQFFATDPDEAVERLGSSGTIVYMPNCDRLTYSTAKTLADHALKDMGRIYRRFIDKGVRIFVNNRQVEAFDPTYWMTSARHTKIDGLADKRSSLVDSWSVPIPIGDGRTTTEIRIRLFMLPVHSWASLPRATLRNSLHVYDDHTVSYMRNEREIEIGPEPRLKLKKHHTNTWLRVEIDFNGDADEAFGVSTNKQGVRLQEFATEAILKHDTKRFESGISSIRKAIRDRLLKIAAAEHSGQTSDAEKHASDTEGVQGVSLPAPPVDTEEQVAALAANLRGLAVSLRQDGETDEDAYNRIQRKKYLTEFRAEEYAPFYASEYRFGKLILRINTAHPFYQKVWQPLAELAKGSMPDSDIEGGDAIGEVMDAARRALSGLQMLLLSLARAQAQMLTADEHGDQNQLFRNLRKSWSDVLETQLMHL